MGGTALTCLGRYSAFSRNQMKRVGPGIHLIPRVYAAIWSGHGGDMYDQNMKGDAGKLQLTLVPRRIIKDIAAIRMYGNQKYGAPEGWRRVEKERYRDAMFRHLLAYLDHPSGVDEESGMPHLWHLACNVAFLCELEDQEAENEL